MRNLIWVVILSFLSLSTLSSQALKERVLNAELSEVAGRASEIFETPLAGEILTNSNSSKWGQKVSSIRMREHGSPQVRAIKASKADLKANSYNPQEEQQGRASDPIIGASFEANWMEEGTPPDDAMAISNGGKVVTANNDGIEFYNANGQFLSTTKWADFFNDATLTGAIYDPRVIYDSGTDRFVIAILHGSSAATSKLIVCFSKSNDPSSGWWYYKLSGNPLNNNCWFDFPSLGVSNNEIYVTGNLYTSGNDTYNQSIIYQIKKAEGFAGQNLNWQYWDRIAAGTEIGFSIVPASYGHSGNYGPGIYLVSSESGGGNTVKLWDITNDIGANPELKSYTITTSQTYGPSPDGAQKGSQEGLDNGDCRMQSAFYLNGKVHFVFHTDIGNGWNGIYYHRLKVNDLTIRSSTFGLVGSYDYSYPAVASSSVQTTDASVLIGFLRTSDQIFPEVRVVNCDNDMQWSNSTLIKEGETYVRVFGGTERWGDYTGICRRQNSPTGRIWFSGSYGARIGANTPNSYKTRVAEIFTNQSTATYELDSEIIESKVYPNPASDRFHVNFETEIKELVTIQVVDINGKLVKQLYQDIPKSTKNIISFNKEALTAGIYFLVISTSTKILSNDKLVITD
ncbi:MAG: T9SS type A sorting domain-containing protein [Saprospiraceae bacterium]|nr:T9SS type A sorting domain-containing protein [Saprospiraceae bacterium]